MSGFGDLAANHPVVERACEQHEGEFAALRDDNRHPARRCSLKPLPERQTENHDCLDQKQGKGEAEDQHRLALQQFEVEPHAYGSEEQAEQQALERCHIGLEFVPILGIRQQRARDERAERCRQTCRLHCQRNRHHGQERRGGHGFRQTGRRDQRIDPVQHELADDDHRNDCAQRLGGGSQVHGTLDTHIQRKQGHEGDKRNGRQILEQQTGKCEPAMT